MMSSEKGCSNCSDISHESGHICNVCSFQEEEEECNYTYTLRKVSPTPNNGDSWTCSFEKLQSKDVTSMTQGRSENLSSDNKDDDQTDKIQEVEQSQSIQRDESSPVKPGSNNDEDRELRLVMIGPTGSGKSATGNTILGVNWFPAEFMATSVTSKCKLGQGERFGRFVSIVDTPGVFDTGTDNNTITKEIVKCISMSTPGPHAFLLVLNVSNRFCLENKKSVEFFQKHFGKNIFDYLIVVFTRKDELKRRNITIENYLEKIPPELESVLQRCKHRYFAIDNLAEDKEKDVENLLEIINQMLATSNGQHYTDEMCKTFAEMFEGKIKHLRSRIENEWKNLKDKIKTLEAQKQKLKSPLTKSIERQEDVEKKLKEVEAKINNEEILTQQMEEKLKQTKLKISVQKAIEQEDHGTMKWLWDGMKTAVKVAAAAGVVIAIVDKFVLKMRGH